MRGKAGSILEQALVHPITEHWRATFWGGKGPITLAGLFHSTYLKIPKCDKNGQKPKMGPELYLDILGPCVRFSAVV
jgi:hypothetical protein